jgi:hypothetical protein
MHRTKHAQQVTDRFRELVENKGDTLPDNHYEELALLIEAAIDTALVEQLEGIANKLDGLTHELRNNAEFFD